MKEYADLLYRIGNCDCLDGMSAMDEESADIVVTSPPYDNLRDYGGHAWGQKKWESVLTALYRIIKPGGVVAWIVQDATVKGSKTGSSFKQALFAMHAGFLLHDVMIWRKDTFTAVGSLKSRYAPVFEYIFILSKGPPIVFNPIKDRVNKHAGVFQHGTLRQKNSSTVRASGHNKKLIQDFGQRHNVWDMSTVKGKKASMGHPATFPEGLVRDLIVSWTNEGAIVLDPFMGSGTTGAAALSCGRVFIGFEIFEDYFAIAEERMARVSV